MMSELNYKELQEKGIFDVPYRAFELVFEHGSIDRANKYADSIYTAPEIKDVLVRAIHLVEQCQ